jgi:dimethylargininase
MLTALTRKPGPALDICELEFLPRQAIDVPKAIEQHRAYEACLADLGARVVSLPVDAGLPDSVFVEDPAIVLDEMAIITRMGAESRRPEHESIAQALARFRELQWLRGPATLEGGDVLRIGKTLYVGVSRRTNPAGIDQLRAIVVPLGYSCVPVGVRGCLHLKTACCALDERTVLANRAWMERDAFEGFRIVDVPPEEPGGANVLRIGEAIVMPSAFPRTAALVESAGFHVRTLDISEFLKAEAGLTCMSLLFS